MNADNRIRIDEIGGNCPVQANGTIDGVPFYFRARGSYWAVEIGPGNTHLAVAAMDRGAMESVEALGCWRHEERYSDDDDPYAAGWMEHDEAQAFIAKAADLWRSATSPARPSSPGGTET